MKAGIVSDLHFNAFKPFATYAAGGENSRLAEEVAVFREAVDKAVAEGCTVLFIPGDITHTRGVIRPSVFNRAFEEISLAAKKIKIVIIPGNHDMENYRGGATAVDTMGQIEGVTVIGAPAGAIMVDGLTIGGIPYIHDHKEFLTVMGALVEGNQGVDCFDCLLIHQGVDGFASPGMPDTGLTADKLREVFQGPIFAGHYHIARRDGNVVSPGSLMQHGFGDSQEPKGVWVWDSDTGAIDLHPIVGPRFVTVTTKKEAEGTAGCYVRVKSETLAKAEKIRGTAEASGAKGVMIVLDKKFAASHAETLKLASPKNMLVQWLSMQPATKGREGELMALYEAICEGGAEA